MNYYFLVDDYDYSISAIIVSEKSHSEIQSIVDDIRSKESDSYYEDVFNALEELECTTVIEKCDFKNIMY